MKMLHSSKRTALRGCGGCAYGPAQKWAQTPAYKTFHSPLANTALRPC